MAPAAFLSGVVIGIVWLTMRTALDPSALGHLAFCLGAGLGIAGMAGRPILRTHALAAAGAVALVATLALGQGAALRLWILGLGGAWPGPLATALLGLLFAMPAAGAAHGRGLVMLALGVGLGSTLGMPIHLWIVAGSAGLLCLLGAGSTPGRLAGAALLLLTAVGSFQQPRADIGPWTAGTLEAGRLVQAPEPGPSPNWAVAGGMGTAQVLSAPGRVTVRLDGLPSQSIGRAAKAEAMAGLVAGLVSERPDTVVILGDHFAHALTGISRVPRGFTLLPTPLPDLVRVVADVLPEARASWLSPAAGLQPVHPVQALHMVPSADLIVEVVGAPWMDAFSSGLQPHHLDNVAKKLGASGQYVLLIHLGWWDSASLGVALRGITDRFAHVQAWVPPEGADSLLLVAGPQAPAMPLLIHRLERLQAPLASLGFEGPVAIAGAALGDADSLRAWAASLPVAPWWWPHHSLHRGAALASPPKLHLASLARHPADATALWDLSPDLVPRIEARMSIHRRMLQLLEDAVSGDMASVFEEVRSLATLEGATAQLEGLVAPHVADGRAALARFIAGDESALADAQRYGATARMLAPSAVPPLLLQADVARASGQLHTATTHFEAALELNPNAPAAHTGLAHLAYLRRDLEGEERHLREVVRLEPQAWEGFQNLGTLLFRTERLTEAAHALERAMSLAPTDQARPRLALIEVHLANGQASRALVMAATLIQDIDSGHARLLRGRAYLELDQLSQAETDFQEAILQEPSMALALAGVAQVRVRRGDLGGAEAALVTALESAPGNGAIRENLRRVQARIRAAGLQEE